MDRIKQACSLGLSRGDVFEMAAAYRVRQFNREIEVAIEDPAVSRALFMDFIGGREHEVFAVAYLDTRHRVIKLEVAFKGTIDGATVYPRVVATRALELGAAAVLLGHNHPSGVPEPSLADQAITRRLKDALALLDVKVLDHVVVGNNETVSMAERGMV